MDMLIIGGTKFAGRALTEELLRKGHNVTLFHRGQTNPDIFPNIERIKGDRDGEISNLGNRTWDVVIDTCGYVPRIVKLSLEYLKDRVKKYVFISTISVYTEGKEINRDEHTDLVTLEDETQEEITGETYGGLKVLCEKAVEEVYGDKALIIRPGLIVGPYDPTNRFTYWPIRIRKGKNVLTPLINRYTQFIDVRDLAKFTVTLIESGKSGIFNGSGVALTLDNLFNQIKDILSSNASFISFEDQFLLDNKVGPWMQLPLWMPGDKNQGLMQISINKALNAGITFKPLKLTVDDTLQWYDSIDGDNQEWPAGMDINLEQELLEKISGEKT